MINFLIILKNCRKNGIKIKSFGYSKNPILIFFNIKKINKFILLKISIDKKSIFLKLNNNNKNYIMNILCCIAIVEELNLRFNKLKNFFKKQAFLKGEEK